MVALAVLYLMLEVFSNLNDPMISLIFMIQHPPVLLSYVIFRIPATPWLTCRCPLYLQLMTEAAECARTMQLSLWCLAASDPACLKSNTKWFYFPFSEQAKPVTLCCSCWTSPSQLQASGCSVLSALLEKQRCHGRGIIWLSWQVPTHFCDGHIPTWHPATSCSLDSWSQSKAFICAPNLSWKITWSAAIYFCLAVCLETVGVFLLTFTKNIYLEAYSGV